MSSSAGQPPQGPSDPYGPYGPYGTGPGYAVPPTNGKAVAALWTGVAALVLTFCCGAGVLGVVPVALGVRARVEIRRSGGWQGGDGMALAGIVTGAVAIVLSLVVIALLVLLLLTGDVSTGTGYDGTGV